MIVRTAVLMAIFATGAAGAWETEPAAAHPMLDGDCEEYSRSAKRPIGSSARHYAVGDGVALYLFQDRDYVWLCYTLPENSFGMADLTIAAPGLEKPLNLHVSAQLGEWPAGDAAPAAPDSPEWWNQQGWYATTVPFNGATAALDADGKPRVDYNFRMTRARELQLSKQRFGRGEWRWHIDIRNVSDGKGGQTAFRFPEKGDETLRTK